MITILVKCKCGKEYQQELQEYNKAVRRGWTMYCSRRCRTRYRQKLQSRNGKNVPCEVCGKVVYKLVSVLKNLNIFSVHMLVRMFFSQIIDVEEKLQKQKYYPANNAVLQ